MSEQDYELLSAYLDGMLTEAERSALEARLQAEPALRRELTMLRETVTLIQELPTLKAPRDLTLTADVVGQRKRVVRFPVLSTLSAAASIALIVIGFVLVQSTPPVEETPANVALAATETPLPTVSPPGTEPEIAAPEAELPAGDAPPPSPQPEAEVRMFEEETADDAVEAQTRAFIAPTFTALPTQMPSPTATLPPTEIAQASTPTPVETTPREVAPDNVFGTTLMGVGLALLIVTLVTLGRRRRR